MVKLRWFLSLLALGTIAVLTQLWILEGSRTPEGLADEAEELLALEQRDYDGALRKLTRGIEQADEEGHDELVRTLLLRRAGIFRMRSQVNAAHRRYDILLALEDCLAVLDRFPDDPEALAEGAACSLDAEESEQGLRLAQRLAEVASPGEAELLMGRAHVMLAEEALEEVGVELEDRLAHAPAVDALAAARSAATLPPDSPLQEVAYQKLREAVPDTLFQLRARDAIERAADHFADAARAFVRQIEVAPHGKAIAGLQRILIAAGALEEAIDLGQFALSDRRLTPRYGVLYHTLEALMARDRIAEARALAISQRPSQGTRPLVPARDDFDSRGLAEWCVMLYQLELWQDLPPTTRRLRVRNLEAEGMPELTGLAELLELAALVRQSESRELTEEELESFDSLIAKLPPADSPEAFPGMHFAAWLTRSEAERIRGDPNRHRAALARAIPLVPAEFPGPELRRLAGDAYARLGQMRLERTTYSQAEVLLTHALRLLPSRRSELEPAWREAGRHALEERGRTVEDVLEAPNRRDALDRFPEMGPYEAMLRAEALVADDSHAAATELFLQVLTRFPGMPVALELQARSDLDVGLVEKAIDAELELARTGFHDADAPSFLDRIPIESFRDDQLLQWVVLEPDRVPRTPLIRRLVELGRHETLRATIRSWDPDALAPRDRVEIVDSLVDIGAWREARRLMRTIEPDSGVLGQLFAAGILIELGLQPAEPERIDFFVYLERFTDEPDLSGRRLLEAIDALVAHGRGGTADVVIDMVDERTGPTPDSMIRAAYLALRAGDRARALELVERSEPYFEDGTIELARMALAHDDDDPGGITRAALALLDLPLGFPPEARAILLSLAGDPATAERILGETTAGVDPFRRQLVLSTIRRLLPGHRIGDELPAADPVTAAELDAHDALVFLALMQTRPGCIWALGRLGELDGDVPTSVHVLASLCQLRLGAPERADAHIAPFAVAGRTGAMPWEVREHIARGRSIEHLRALQLDRRRARARSSLDAVGWALAGAREALQGGRAPLALTIVERTLEVLPDEPVLRVERARLLAANGQLVDALRAYDEILTGTPPASTDLGAPALDLIGELVELLHLGRSEGLLTNRFLRAQLEVLAVSHPDDPMLARELAQLHLASEEEDLRWGVERAWDQLERFRDRTDRAPIESLRRGEARRWAELFRRHHPETAERFVHAELGADAANPELWHLWARAQNWAGQRAAALRTYRAVTSLVSDPDIDKDYAVLLADDDTELSVLRATLQTAPTRSAGVDPELVLRRGLALLGGTEQERQRGLIEANAVWRNRAENGIPIAELGRLIALRLVREGYSERARTVLAEAIADQRDPLQRGVLQVAARLLEWKQNRGGQSGL